MKAIMFITLLALSFIFVASQSRMRPTNSDAEVDSAQLSQEDVVLANSQSDNDESAMPQEQETHDTDLIYGRSRFSDVYYAQDAEASDSEREQEEDHSDAQEYANFLEASSSL